MPAEPARPVAGRPPAPRLIMLSGPIASGKSTVAALVADAARGRGLAVALTDLDTVAEMALPTLPDWDWAHRVHAELVGAWLGTDVELVVDEGTSTREEVDLVRRHAAGVSVAHVILVADLERAHARATADPGRGLSRDYAFLRADHERFAAELAQLPCDLLIDVERGTPEQHAAAIVERFLPDRR